MYITIYFIFFHNSSVNRYSKTLKLTCYQNNLKSIYKVNYNQYNTIVNKSQY
nr:MAG TPA_asm: hypothetical protein [Caudoviricetes sp.]